MRWGWSAYILAAALAAGLASAAAAAPEPLALDDVLTRMSEKAGSVKDLRATIQKTSWDSFFEEKHLVRLELFYIKPDLERLDTWRKIRGKEVHTQQVIVGKDFTLKVWPDQKTGRRERVDPEEMKRRREDRNDPLTFFRRKPDDLKKDFNLDLRKSPKPGTVGLVIVPKSKEVRFDYRSVELVVDTKTWMPTSVKATSKDKEDWSLYEMKTVKVNAGLEASDFQPPPGIRIEEVNGGDERKAAEPAEK